MTIDNDTRRTAQRPRFHPAITVLRGDDGGDPPCWSHLYDDLRPDLGDRVAIELLVRNFYREAARDTLLGPVFEVARLNWHTHIATLVDFWAWQLLGEPGYVGQPLRAHEPVHARTPLRHAHYERWVALFTDTVDSWFAGPIADAAKMRARKMATEMEDLLAGREGADDESMEPLWRRCAIA